MNALWTSKQLICLQIIVNSISLARKNHYRNQDLIGFSAVEIKTKKSNYYFMAILQGKGGSSWQRKSFNHCDGV